MFRLFIYLCIFPVVGMAFEAFVTPMELHVAYYAMFGAIFAIIVERVPEYSQGMPEFRYGWNDTPAYYLKHTEHTIIYLCNAFYDPKLCMYMYWAHHGDPEHCFIVPESYIGRTPNES